VERDLEDVEALRRVRHSRPAAALDDVGAGDELRKELAPTDFSESREGDEIQPFARNPHLRGGVVGQLEPPYAREQRRERVHRFLAVSAKPAVTCFDRRPDAKQVLALGQRVRQAQLADGHRVARPTQVVQRELIVEARCRRLPDRRADVRMLHEEPTHEAVCIAQPIRVSAR
jgi:hypothetical protein